MKFITLLERDREKIEEGIEKGIEQAKIEDAENLIKLGVNIEIIIKATGLSKEKVDNIYDEVMRENKE